MQDENSFIPLSGAAVASKSAICCSMLPTFSGDMLFCVTSARNAVISDVSDVVSIISIAVWYGKSIVDRMGGKRQEKFYFLCQIYKNISYRYDKFNITRLYITSTDLLYLHR